LKTEAYIKAQKLLLSVCTEKGFLASKSDISNYKRIWSRDGVICGLASLLSENKTLLKTFKQTLITLSENQYYLGNIPSNVWFNKGKTDVSFGGLCGRVDTISWYIIGVCNYVWFTKDFEFLKSQIKSIDKGFLLLESWEFNNKHLIYVPTSGNWADEYPIEGYTLYDNCLRLWALQCYHKLKPSTALESKIEKVRNSIEINFTHADTKLKKYHPKALNNTDTKPFWLAAFSPKGYNTKFDAFGNALTLILGLNNNNIQARLVNYLNDLSASLELKLIPAFWPPIHKNDKEWADLESNNAYEFRNYPYEFHNGGTWAVVNAFIGMGLKYRHQPRMAEVFLEHLNNINKSSLEKDAHWAFYENFNTHTAQPIGVPYCAWSAAATLLLTKSIEDKSLLIE